MEKNPQLRAAITKLGGLSATARALNAGSYQTVQQWLLNGQVPAKYCPALEELTGVSRRYLRPKDHFLYWPELATRPTKEAGHA